MTSSLFSLNADHGFPNLCCRHIIRALAQSLTYRVSIPLFKPTGVCLHTYTDLTEAGPKDVKSQLVNWEQMSQKNVKNWTGAFTLKHFSTKDFYESHADLSFSSHSEKGNEQRAERLEGYGEMTSTDFANMHCKCKMWSHGLIGRSVDSITVFQCPLKLF